MNFFLKKSAPLVICQAGCKAFRPSAHKRAFTRVDLVCSVGVVILLTGLVALECLGERGRTLRCAHNLKCLGSAMRDFANEHDGALPAASNTLLPATWDTAITPYLRPDLDKVNTPYGRRLLQRAVAPTFACPSDRVLRDHPRSYAMTWHEMQPEDWPPGPDNPTGVGLTWDKPSAERLLGTGAWDMARTNGALLKPVKLSWLPDPANTLLLTELPRSLNQYGSSWCVAVQSARDQVERFEGDLAQFHGGRFNYLMADGHVELLSPFHTGYPGAFDAVRPTGIWTIKPGD